MTSVVIPCYTLTPSLEVMAYNCAKSYRPHTDQLIVVEDGGTLSKALEEIADVYLNTHENKGFTYAVNLGWHASTREYAAIVNSDTYLAEGSLEELCIPGRVTHPRVIGDADPPIQFGAFFVVPSSIVEEYGRLDEQFKMYYSDYDYYRRVRHLVQEVPWVTFGHGCGVTTDIAINSDLQREMADRDRELFNVKWNDNQTVNSKPLTFREDYETPS